MASPHLYKLSQQEPDEKTAAGVRIKANKQNFPILQGMSLYKLILNPNGIREPHWHANADELGYCLSGEVLITLYHTGDKKATFLVQPGQVFLIPSGALHCLENVGSQAAELILNFSHENTEDFNLSTTLGAFSDAVLGNVWQVPGAYFNSLKRSSTAPIFAAIRTSSAIIPEEARYTTPYRYNLDGSQPILTNSEGIVRTARQNVWPIVSKQALYSLTLTGQGMRDPHWHPETAELGYIKNGKGRMSILNPCGQIDTYIMEKGDLYFIPKAYPHHIENLESENLEILIFFDRAMPQDIGFTGSVKANSNEVLGAITGTDVSFFAQLPKYYKDLFIVKKFNAVDN